MAALGRLSPMGCLRRLVDAAPECLLDTLLGGLMRVQESQLAMQLEPISSIIIR